MDTISKSIACVVTTTSNGQSLERLALPFYKTDSQARLIIVGDINTPEECRRRALNLQEAGYSLTFITVQQQMAFLSNLPEIAPHIPYKSDARRNIGFLWALANNYDVLISIDDDNFPEEDFLDWHSRTGEVMDLPVTTQEDGWFNCMSLLSCRDGVGKSCHPYPRGFPYRKRGGDKSGLSGKTQRARVAAAAGLWIGDPDVDAITRATLSPTATEIVNPHAALSKGARCPINTQNTSVIRDAICVYFFPAVSATINGMRVSRFGDILSGLFLQMCAEAVGHQVRFGLPTVVQRRNPHDVFQDLMGELPGIMLLEHMRELIESPLGSHSLYSSAYLELIDRISLCPIPAGAPKGTCRFLRELASAMVAWRTVCFRIAERISENAPVG